MVESLEPRAKLVDFGLARILTRGVQPLGGAPAWVAPEVIIDPHARPKPSCDVFSFGRLVYLVFAAKHPLDGLCKETIVKRAREGHTMPLAWPEEMPMKAECYDLCEKTSQLNPELRPNVQHLQRELSAWRLAGLETAHGH